MTTTMWITGASSGIGAAVAQLAVERVDDLISFSRRPATVGRWIAADLADPRGWALTVDEISRGLRSGTEHAVLFHCSGTGEPASDVVDADPEEYRRSVLLNFAAGPAVGQGFLNACRAAGVRSTLVLCGSPAADKVPRGLAHYSAGKAGLHHWARCVAGELEGSGSRVVTVVPYAVETALVHAILAEDPEEVPLSQYFRSVQENGAFATPGEAAEQIWTALNLSLIHI